MREKNQLTTEWQSSAFRFSCGLDAETLEKTHQLQDLIEELGLRKPSMSLLARQGLHVLHKSMNEARLRKDGATLQTHLDALRWLRRRGLKG